MTTQERDRVISATFDYLRTVRESLARASEAVNIGAAIALSENKRVLLESVEESYNYLGEAAQYFVGAIRFYGEISGIMSSEGAIDCAMRARNCASFTIGEVEKAADAADSAGAWMVAQSVYDAIKTAKAAQTAAWEAEQEISK